MMTKPTDITAPVSQPIQNVLIPSVEKRVTKTQMAVMVCSKVWPFGLICMLGYMLISWLRIKNRIKTSVPIHVSLDCGTVKVYQSDLIESPFLFGIISPRIYIPSPIADKELPYVIIHEMTHKKKKDYLIKPIGFLLLSVYWFNPFVWIAYIMLCKDIELICDEQVIKKLGASCKKEYSQALLNSAVNRRMIAACPVAFGEVSVKERVKNVLNYKKPAFWVLVAAVLACIIVPVCFMTQKKAKDPELTVVSEETDEIPSEDYNLDDLFSVSGEYEMINPDPDKYTLGLPGLMLQEDGQFSFGYDPLSSYLCIGEYELTGDKLQAVTDDGKYHYRFTWVSDGSLLIFDAENSSDVSR
ncbi:MAG: M56 family metallopeptidase, partial [Lachnospiraceae bacterium]|nr:M56 family metallopeptidase [Lachnospiraceae bacterium]